MTIDHAARPSRSISLLISAIFLTLASAEGIQLSAQQGHGVAVGGDKTHALAAVFPHSGAPGTILRVAPKNLPPNTVVQVMMGGLQSGFEVISRVATNDRGELEGSDVIEVAVPDWVQTDHSYLVMVTDTLYAPLASADIFHPTDRNGGLQRAGNVTFDDPKCPVLTGALDEIYFLVGDTSGLHSGGGVVVKGKVVDPTSCGDMTTISVESSHPFPF